MRRVWCLCAAIALVLSFTPPVLAASPPSNDDISNATVIPADTPFPSVFTQSTAGATASANDQACFGPAPQATVWYVYTPPAGTRFLIDASASDYPVEVDVFSGSPGNLFLDACGSPTAAVLGFPDTATYFIMFAEIGGSSAGGNLSFTLAALPAPPTIHVAVSPLGSADPKAGTVTVSGTVDCTAASAARSAPLAVTPDSTPGGGTFAEVDINVTQRVGRIATIQGFGSTGIDCGVGMPWSMTIFPISGLFKPGSVGVQAHAFVCDEFGQCAEDFQTTTVRVRKG